MPLSDEQLASLLARVESLEHSVRSMKALAKGEPGRDGKDGRDGRDGRSVNARQVLSAISNLFAAPRAPNVNCDAHIQIPDGAIVMHAPAVHVASPQVHLEAVIETPAPVVNVTAEAKAPIVNIKQEPAQVSVTLPPRKTISEIERDSTGQMTRVTQIENDA